MTFGDRLFGDGTFGNAAAWSPGDAWPSTTIGGARSPHWGGYVRLWIRAGLAPGKPFHIGTHTNAFLDDGNVMGGAEAIAAGTFGAAGLFGAAGTFGTLETTDRLWVDLSCDTLDCEIAGGAQGGQGIFAKFDARTLSCTLHDPDGKYDPLNTNSPYQYAGRSRLVPGTPVDAFAEIVTPAGTWSRRWLFTGTADSWGEDWTPNRNKRQAKLVATDGTKQFVRYNQPEQPEQGAGDTTGQRVQRIVDAFGWTGTIEAAPTSTVTLAATTLAQNGWELLNRTLDDELGYVYFTMDGHLRWVDRTAWFTLTDPVVNLGCHSDCYDVLIDAAPSNLDRQMRNAIYAARTGGISQAAVSTTSIATYGEYDYKRTDLGLADDTQVAEWAQTVLELYAYPQVTLESVTAVPAIDPESWDVWDDVLAVRPVTDMVRVYWAPPDRPDHVIDTHSRLVGTSHKITYRSWEVEWALVQAQSLTFTGQVFTMGPDDQDALDAGWILGV